MSALLALGLLGACSGKGARSAENDRGKRDTKIRTESCSRSNGFDTNRDGKKDLFEAVNAGKIVCRASDLDFDGSVDQTTFFEPGGAVRRREIDLDGNGVPNLVETFQAGKLVLRSIDGASLGRFDMWDSYDAASGVRTTRERDTNGDGRIDEYWTFTGPRITVRFDRNDDGAPDEEGALVWGEGVDPNAADGGAAGTAGAATGASADGGTAPVARVWTDAGTEKPAPAPEGSLTDAGAGSSSATSDAGKTGATR